VADPDSGSTIVPLDGWAPVHPAAAALVAGQLPLPDRAGSRLPRSAALAAALAEANRAWGNPVDAALDRWLAGADAVVTGQQPGLLGGPLLTLVKACAVAAEVARRRAAGASAVGFLWLATSDDDLPETAWARVAVGEAVLEAREEGWRRGQSLSGAVALGDAAATLVERLGEGASSEHGRAAQSLALACYAPGTPLGEATARFLGALLRDLEIVLVDACEVELGRSAAPIVHGVLGSLERVWDALHDGTSVLTGRGWSPPLKITPATLPLFRRHGSRRERVATAAGACPPALLEEAGRHPERFLPNAWLRPLVQDGALDTTVAILGSAELAYHAQAAAVWPLAGLCRPEWRLRPHVTVVTAADRRLAAQLRVTPEHLLRARLPAHLLPGGKVARASRRLAATLEGKLGDLDRIAAAELPALRGDLDATRRKVAGSLSWLDGRIASAATRQAETEVGRWRRLRAFVRPNGRPQERELSVLAPLLRLGPAWARELSAALDPCHPGMHLLYWQEGERW
jgi:uncharacterized protein YllA (UPF0747 family)